MVSLPAECQLEFDQEANSFEIIKSEEDYYNDEDCPSRSPKDIQDEQALLVKEIVFKNQSKHQEMLNVVREKITERRALESGSGKRGDIKKHCQVQKEGCLSLTMTWYKSSCDDPYKKEDGNPRKQKQKFGQKVGLFGKACIALQKDEDAGYRKAWKNVYKHLKNNYVTKVDATENENVENPIQLLKHSTFLTKI